jgi:hypothetical protein
LVLGDFVVEKEGNKGKGEKRALHLIRKTQNTSFNHDWLGKGIKQLKNPYRCNVASKEKDLIILRCV